MALYAGAALFLALAIMGGILHAVINDSSAFVRLTQKLERVFIPEAFASTGEVEEKRPVFVAKSFSEKVGLLNEPLALTELRTMSEYINGYEKGGQ